MRPHSARPGARDHLRIVEPQGGERARIFRAIGTHLDVLGGYAHIGQHRTNFLQRTCGGRLVAGAGRHIDDNAAGRIVAPAVREGDNVAALVDRQLPALGADEQLDCVDALPNGDRVALADVIRNVLNCRAVGVAAREHRGATDHHQQPGAAGAARLDGRTVR